MKTNIHIIALKVAFLIGFVVSSDSYADIWVVSSSNSNIVSLSKEQCQFIWLGELDAVDGYRVIVADQFTSSKVRTRFYWLVARMDQEELRAHWAKKVFTSGRFPPESVSDDFAVIEWVKKEKNRLGYIDSKSYIDGLKVLYVIKE